MSVASLILNRSISRRKLLSLFFENEDKEYYLREMAYITGVPPSNVKRELKGLADDKFFLTTRRGNLLFYKLNKQHPLFKELKKILSNEIGLEFELRSIFRDLKGINTAFIYGSFATNKNRSDSDVDIMIVGATDKDFIEHKVSELEKKYQKEINYQIISLESFEKKKRERNSFILGLLKSRKIILGGTKDEC